MEKRLLVATTVVLTFVSASIAFGVTPVIWRDDTQGEFEKGEPENLSITSEGEVMLAPAFEEVTDTGELHVWCLAEDAKGNLYAGTGNKGKIFKISPEGEQTLFFDSPEVGIHSLAIDGKGNVYAGSSPDGIVYKIKPDGGASTFCTTGESYVWSLAFGPKGELYAGTGNQGRILKISADGKVEEVYRSTDHHIMCLVSDGSGNLYAGTEGSGLVYKIAKSGEVFVLYDAPEKEIHSLALGPGGILYAGAIAGSSQVGKTPEKEEPEPEGKSVIYRIDPSGTVAKVWESSEPLLLSMVVDDEDQLMVGTGNKGLIFQVTDEGGSSILAKCRDSKPLSLRVGNGGEILVGTGDAGRIYKLGSSYAEEGTLLSKEHDFSINSKWGRVSWRAEMPKGTKVSFQTRSGNTENADDTWSEWSEELDDPSGSQIKSPPARFLQYRAKLSTSNSSITPILEEVSVASLQDNLRPRIESVRSYPYRGKGERPPDSSGPSAPPPSMVPAERMKEPKVLKKGLRIIEWRADDPNEDSLTYNIFFRGIDERDWKLLKEDLTATFYLWDTESAPDGTTVLKVVASDSPDNPDDLALSAEKIGEPFEVDNTGPKVSELKAKQTGDGEIIVYGTAEDATSPLKKGEYSIDSGKWRVIFPKDRIFDSRKEDFSLTVRGLSPGEHTVVVRVTDLLDNVGIGKIVVDVRE